MWYFLLLGLVRLVSLVELGLLMRGEGGERGNRLDAVSGLGECEDLQGRGLWMRIDIGLDPGLDLEHGRRLLLGLGVEVTGRTEEKDLHLRQLRQI
jgi:hypothetical protein